MYCLIFFGELWCANLVQCFCVCVLIQLQLLVLSVFHSVVVVVVDDVVRLLAGWLVTLSRCYCSLGWQTFKQRNKVGHDHDQLQCVV